jgi:hypothetical protein
VAQVEELERRAASLRADMTRLGPEGMPPEVLAQRLGDTEGGIEDALSFAWGPVWWPKD